MAHNAKYGKPHAHMHTRTSARTYACTYAHVGTQLNRGELEACQHQCMALMRVDKQENNHTNEEVPPVSALWKTN